MYIYFNMLSIYLIILIISYTINTKYSCVQYVINIFNYFNNFVYN